MGKDFSRNSVEITGMTTPGGYIAFSGIDYDLYSRGGSVFLTEEQVITKFPLFRTVKQLKIDFILMACPHCIFFLFN